MVRAEDSGEILSTGPSFAYGGRYNKSGEFGALYLGDTREICRQEKLKQVAWREDALPPQALGSVEIRIDKVLDLTQEKILKALGITESQLIDPLDVSLPRALAQAAREAGIKALLAPSAAGERNNLVIFEDYIFDSSCHIKLLKIETR